MKNPILAYFLPFFVCLVVGSVGTILSWMLERSWTVALVLILVLASAILFRWLYRNLAKVLAGPLAGQSRSASINLKAAASVARKDWPLEPRMARLEYILDQATRRKVQK